MSQLDIDVRPRSGPVLGRSSDFRRQLGGTEYAVNGEPETSVIQYSSEQAVALAPRSERLPARACHSRTPRQRHPAVAARDAVS